MKFILNVTSGIFHPITHSYHVTNKLVHRININSIWPTNGVECVPTKCSGKWSMLSFGWKVIKNIWCGIDAMVLYKQKNPLNENVSEHVLNVIAIHHSWKSVDKPNTNWCDCIGCGTVFVRSMRICETFIHSCFCKIPSKCLCLMSYFMCICAVSVTIARTTDVLLYCMMLFSLAINRTHSPKERSNIQTPFDSLVALQCGKLVNIVESIL